MLDTLRSILFRAVVGFIAGGILYFILLYVGVRYALTTEDTYVTALCVSSVSLVILLLLIGHEDENLFLHFFRPFAVAFSYHAVFWFYTFDYYDYTNIGEALKVGLIKSVIYLGVLMIAVLLSKKFNLARFSAYRKRKRQEKQRTNLQKEISYLNTKAEGILNEMKSSLFSLDSGFTKTTEDSRALLYLLSSISDEDYSLKLSQQNIEEAEKASSDNLSRLLSSIDELKAVTSKVKLLQSIGSIKEQLAELEGTVGQLAECVKKQDSQLPDTFKQEDRRVLYIHQAKKEYQNLVRQFNNVG